MKATQLLHNLGQSLWLDNITRDLLNSPRWERLYNAGARPQRLLWASTGTKDPKVSDVLYIKALAAPFTVNTMPEGTLKALADHGDLSEIMSADGGDCEVVLDQFAAAGIDIDQLAAKLQDDGAKSFRQFLERSRGGYRFQKRRSLRRRAEYVEHSMNVLVVDIGGTHVKVLATGHKAHREFDSGPTLTPHQMVAGVKKLVADWKYEAISIGYPGPVLRNKPVSEPWNLGKGWAGFDFEAAFKCPVKVVNDAVMQALGSYKGGKMLFLGLGTGLGSAMILDGIIEPMELGHLPYKKATFENYVGIRGVKKYGKKKWRSFVSDVVKRLVAALEPDDVVLGGGNVKKLKELPSGSRAGDNNNAFLGGFRLWQKSKYRASH